MPKRPVKKPLAKKKPARVAPRKAAVRTKRRPRPDTERDRVRNLLALDAAKLVRRLAKRHERMVEVFGHKRDRSALTEPLESWFGSITFRELVLFRPAEQRVIGDFYAAIDELRWYLKHTDDMPGTLATVFDAHRREITDAYEAFTRVLGPPAEAPEPEDVDDLIAEALRAAEQRTKTR